MNSKSLSEPSLEQAFQEYLHSPRAIRVAILGQIAVTLDQAHRNGELLHNLSPKNVLVIGDPQAGPFSVRLITENTGSTSDRDLVQNDSIPETAYYFSPERILGLEITPQSDQFSLAVLAYQFVSGRLPFQLAPTSALFYQICTQNPAPLDSEEVSPVLFQALSKDPHSRFSSCAEFVELLASKWQKTTSTEVPSSIAPSLDAPQVVGISQQGSGSGIAERNRRRRELEFEPDPIPSDRPGTIRLVLAALALVAIALAVFYWRSPKTELPQQVLETRSAPVTPPPTDTSSTPKPSPPPEVKDRQPTANLSDLVEKRAHAASVQFETEPAGVHIVVDNDADRSCQAPCSLSLSPGRHTLTATLDGYRPEQRILNVPQDLSLDIRLSKRIGTLIVTSEPSGSEIEVDGHAAGTTPDTLQLSPGPHQIRVRNGNQQQEDNVEVVADTIQAKRFAWQ